MFMPQKVLVLGSDARTHGIASKLAKSDDVRLFAYGPNENIGIKKVAEMKVGDWLDKTKFENFLFNVRPDIAVAGPENVYVSPILRVLEKSKVPFAGPEQTLVKIETSKIFTRNLLERALPEFNPRFRIFDSEDGIAEYLTELENYVIKPDGLTGGKGVRVSGEHLPTIEHGIKYAREVLNTDGKVLIEEKLFGEEFTLQTFFDGRGWINTFPVQDHKRLLEGDTGPNTGSMGSCNDEDLSLPFLTDKDADTAGFTNVKVAKELEKLTSKKYKGILYGSFIKTKNGLRIIEYNARGGDPELLNILELMRGDLSEVFWRIVDGNLTGQSLGFRRGASVCKYVVPAGYPNTETPSTQVKFDLQSNKVSVYFGDVREMEGELYFGRSRGMAFVGVGDTLAEAERRAELGACSVTGNVYHRRDIGTDTLIKRKLEHIKSL
jgi:phosphoribosylamine---glycine ligase